MVVFGRTEGGLRSRGWSEMYCEGSRDPACIVLRCRMKWAGSRLGVCVVEAESLSMYGLYH